MKVEEIMDMIGEKIYLIHSESTSGESSIACPKCEAPIPHDHAEECPECAALLLWACFDLFSEPIHAPNLGRIWYCHHDNMPQVIKDFEERGYFGR